MQLNKQTDFALRSLLFLAMQERNCLCSIDDIAKNFLIAREHLTKIISRLAKLGYIYAIRGKGGGLKLNSKSLTVPLAEIIKNFEPTFKVIDCERPVCPMNGICRLNQFLGEASNAFVSVLEKYTLNDILPKTIDEKFIVSKRLNINITAG